MVAKKITAIHKQSTKDHKEKCKFDAEIARMEKGAMASYLKDIQNNADMTSQMLNEKILFAKRSYDQPVRQDINLLGESSRDKKKSFWQETKSAEGMIYFWNTQTNETVWEPPAEGYSSIAEVQVIERVQKPKPPPRKPPNKQFNNNNKFNKKGKGNPKKFTPITLKKDPASIPNEIYFGPDTFKAPFGKWTKVADQKVDLQLPEQKRAPVMAPVIKIPTERKFQEKTVVHLKEEDEGESSGSTFKKRKINCNAKRNTRQRLDDD